MFSMVGVEAVDRVGQGGQYGPGSHEIPFLMLNMEPLEVLKHLAGGAAPKAFQLPQHLARTVFSGSP